MYLYVGIWRKLELADFEKTEGSYKEILEVPHGGTVDAISRTISARLSWYAWVSYAAPWRFLGRCLLMAPPAAIGKHFRSSLVDGLLNPPVS